jgi:ATP-dependent RNA helicase DDX31/DBP7
MAIASYSLGNPEDCFKQANEVIEHATTFEDKFMAYCVYIKLLGVASTDRAIEKLLYLLPFVGETIDPNAITQQLALDELMSLKQTLGGNQKDILLQLSPMTDSRILMSMKLMGLLVLYSSQQKAFLSGYLATRMIRISLQYGQCDDTVYAMSVFCSSLVYTVNDMDEAYSLAQIALSLMKNYNANQLIPRVYGLIYGTVVTIRDTQQSTLAPLLSACHLAFNRGIHEHAVLNTLIYVRQSLFGGKCIPALLDELASLTQKHVSASLVFVPCCLQNLIQNPCLLVQEKLSQISVIKHFLAPTYNSLSVLSGIVLDEPAVLAEYAKEPTDDIIVDVIAQNELVYVRACVATVLFESIILRDFAKASEVVLNYSQFFEVTAVLELNLYFMAGLVSLHMARQTRESCWKEKGTKMLASYENWSRSNPSNYAHKYLLLKAEYHQLMGETDAAIEAYEASINSARTYQFIQDEAIACEGRFYF